MRTRWLGAILGAVVAMSCMAGCGAAAPAPAEAQEQEQEAAEAEPAAPAEEESAEAAEEPAAEEPAAEAGEEAPEEMSYMSPDGWVIRYDPKVFESNEIDEHAAQFVYLGESTGSNVAEVRYIEGKSPEEVLDERTAGWEAEPLASEGIFPGPEDTPGFWRMSPAADEGPGMYETLIAGAYKDGTLLLDCVEHKSGNEEDEMLVSDMMSNLIGTITYGDFE